MAGRYWYLEEEKDERMVKACQRFENQFHDDPVHLLFSIRYKGDLELIKDTFAGKTLLKLHQDAKAKHSWYEDFRNKGPLKYTHTKYDHEKHKTKDAIIKWSFIGFLAFIVILICIGGVTVLNWIFF